jgi:hypothetical protein
VLLVHSITLSVAGLNEQVWLASWLRVIPFIQLLFLDHLRHWGELLDYVLYDQTFMGIVAIEIRFPFE